ncbi:MAG: Amidase [Acidimicrobiales bacterium]|nr:Amidase [Acidimicrobiales bacterium]
MNADDLGRLDATATAELIAKGEVTAAEVVDAALARIDRMNPELNAVIHRQDERGRAEAAGPLSGPLAGVPFLLKDAVCHFDGDPEHFGMRALRDADHHARGTSWLAERFRAAGLVTLGRTNLPEMATTITTEPVVTGATHNPWDTSRSTGGSSGGAAAAVASGMVPVAHANDMGGSIRIPAAHCGLVGLKPTRARTTLGPDLGELWGPLTHEHVLTRSVRDTATVLDAIAGPGPGDPYTAPPPVRPFLTEVGADPGRLRVAWRTDRCDGTGASHTDCVTAVEGAAKLLASLGHQVEAAGVEVLDAPVVSEQLPVLFGAIVAREVDRWSAVIGRPIGNDELEPFNAFMADMGRGVSGAQWLAGIEAVQRWSRDVALWFEDDECDVLVTPVSPEPPTPLGELTVEGQGGDVFTLVMRVAGLTTFTFPWNLTGQPAISLPLHWSDDGLPIGVQLIARTGREDVLLRLAAQIESAAPWADHRPPVSA